MLSGSFRRSVALGATIVAVPWLSAQAQEPAPVDRTATEQRTVGTVEAVGRGSVVLRKDDGSFTVYTVNRDTIRATPVATGARVSVVTLSTDTDPAPTALAIDTLPKPQGLAEAPPAAEPAAPEAVPAQVRRLEQQVERQARKYRLGFYGGAGLDPELISLDVFATLGPFFTRNFQFRPAGEFAFGEVTTLFGIHLDGLYRFPVARTTRWAPYLGAGPTFSFSHRGFETQVEGEEGETDRFDWGEFNWNNGFNFIVGVRNPNGTFFELKATPYGISKVRMLGGLEF